MCTVSVVPDRDGFRLLCNRDERRQRPDALPPQWRQLPRRMALYPVDPVGPGTWIGVNESGLAAALLNRTMRGAPARSAAPRLSRGLIVPMLLDELRLHGAITAARGLDLCAFGLFRVVLIESEGAAILTSDGQQLAVERVEALPFVLTSSSLGDDLVETPRRGLFQGLLGDSPNGWLHAQERFHSHQWPARPDISVLMERADACTVSWTAVSVTSSGVRLRYTALDQHRAAIAHVA